MSEFVPLIIGLAVFIAGMCVGAAFMFIFLTWDPQQDDGYDEDVARANMEGYDWS